MTDDLSALGGPIRPTRHEALQAQAALCALMHSIVAELEASSGFAWHDLALVEGRALLAARRPALGPSHGSAHPDAPTIGEPVVVPPRSRALPVPAPRFYRGDLPPRPADLERVRRALRRGPLHKQVLIERTGLSQNQVHCAVDALIAAGEVTYDATSGEFAPGQP